MTRHEKLALETSASLCDTIAANLGSIAAIHELLSVNLPNLSPEQRNQLQTDTKLGLENAQKLKENAKTLRSIAAQG